MVTWAEIYLRLLKANSKGVIIAILNTQMFRNTIRILLTNIELNLCFSRFIGALDERELFWVQYRQTNKWYHGEEDVYVRYMRNLYLSSVNFSEKFQLENLQLLI